MLEGIAADHLSAQALLTKTDCPGLTVTFCVVPSLPG